MCITRKTSQFSLLLLLFTSNSFAGAMNEEQMQAMMQQMQKMQQCMAKIDQSGMDRLAQRGKTMEAELQSLCDAGKRDEAKQTAIVYGKEIAESKEMQQLKKCGEVAPDLMDNMSMPAIASDQSATDDHVCDSL